MDIIRTMYYIHGPRVDEIKFLLFYTCDERWALHVVIKRKFFLHLLLLMTVNCESQGQLQCYMQETSGHHLAH